MKNSSLLKISREFNEDIHKGKWAGKMPWFAIDPHIPRIARKIYQEKHHWHSVHGRCIGGVPFEIMMQSLALLACCWVADIFLRKARDRKRPGMEERYKEWRKRLNDILDYVEQEVAKNRDIDAEQAFGKAHHEPNKILCFLNRLRWGH